MATPYFLIAFFLFPLAFAAKSPSVPPFKRIYQFGDSLSDTGNLLRLPGGRMFFPADRLPYGETYFHKATGRFSDGRLIVDHIASALDLPFLDAYLNPNGSFGHGVNFAVAGATANNEDFFTSRNVSISNFKPPITKQLEWFHAHLNESAFDDALFIFGEFGGNDYFSFFNSGRSIDEVRTFVPDVIDSISNGIRHIIRVGAKRILVPGPFPFGCIPSRLSASNSSDPTLYDSLGCIKSFNDFTSYHTDQLQASISSLNEEFSGDGVVIVYVDYDGAFTQILRESASYTFDKSLLLKACCGAGGKYNFDGSKPCGTNGTTVCSDPSRALHWDGVHLTDASYHRIAQIVIEQSISKLI